MGWRRRTYLDLKLLVYLHHLAKDGDVLHETCKFPGTPYPGEEALLFRGVLVHGDGLGAGALSRSHRGGTAVGSEFLGGRLGGPLG